jgi:hypothetical protein
MNCNNVQRERDDLGAWLFPGRFAEQAKLGVRRYNIVVEAKVTILEAQL